VGLSKIKVRLLKRNRSWFDLRRNDTPEIFHP
jgi:hypothetical protein